MHKPIPISRPSLRAVLAVTTVLCGMASQPALADCVADASGTNVNCAGTSPTYVNTASGVTLNADSTASVTGPVVLGSNAAITNAGTVTAGTDGFVIQAGANSSVANTGTISSTGTASTSGGVSLGESSTVTNTGAMTAASGTDTALFGANGTFIQNSGATGAATGNVAYGLNLGGNVATFKNFDTAHGFAGSITASGNTSIYNAGLFNGTIDQTATLGLVNIVNDTGGIYTGTITTGDATTLTNNGTMTLNGYNAIGTLQASGTSLINNGTLSLGSSTTTTATSGATSVASVSIGRTVVYGNFTQSANGTLNASITSSASGAPVAGTSYSQIEAIGASGTANLAGTLNIVATPGFYATGSTYDIVVADQGITGGFSTVTGNALAFITFNPVGVVQLANGQYAYELQAVRSQTYAQALASVGTPNQLAIAAALEPLVATATAAPTGDAATLIGDIDTLSLTDAQTFLDSVSPAGYAAYADALRDQANMFQREVALRMSDQNSSHAEAGPWLTFGHQFHVGSTTGDETSQSITLIQGGYDWSGPNFVVGGSIAYSYDGLKNTSGALAGHNSETQIGGYAAYHFGPLVASAQAAYTFGSLSATKTITLGTVTRTATASASNHLLTAQGTLGFDVKAGGLELSPYGGIAYSKGSISPFTESGASTADLSVSRIDASRTDLIAGATITAASGKWRPYVRAAYRSEIGSDNGGSIDAYFNGDTTTAFTVTAPSASKSEVDVDAGVNIVFLDEGSVYFGYQGTIRSDMTSHGVMAGIRIEF